VVDAVSVEDGRVIVSTPNGSTAIGPVAVELASSGVQMRSLTLRTPTLDDVFRELTGSNIGVEGMRR
jgi:ABC-2 type transport system ATP-binding protein